MRPNNESHMPVLLLSVLRFVRLLLSGHQAVAIENAALRLQLAAFRRKRKRPVLTSFDRLFWVGLSGVWRNWRSPLLYVQADTVVPWQRELFREFWAHLSKVNRRTAADPRPPSRFADSSSEWSHPIRYGVRHGFTENSRCLASRSRSGPSRESSESCRGHPARPGRRFFTTTSAKWFPSISLRYRPSP